MRRGPVLGRGPAERSGRVGMRELQEGHRGGLLLVVLPQRLQHANPRLHLLLAGGSSEVGPLLCGDGQHVGMGAGPGRRGESS